MVSRCGSRTGRSRSEARGTEPGSGLKRLDCAKIHENPVRSGHARAVRHALTGHSVSTAFEVGWARLANGDLLSAAEEAFDAFITTDRNLRYQQNLDGRRLAILVLWTTSWPRIQSHLHEVVTAIDELSPGDFVELSFS